MELGKFKLPFKSNNFLVWGIVIFIILGFGKSSNNLGFSFFNNVEDKHKGSRKHYPDGKNGGGGNRPPLLPIPVQGGAKSFLGGNGLFLIAVIALLFLCKDEKKDNCDEATTIEFNESE